MNTKLAATTLAVTACAASQAPSATAATAPDASLSATPRVYVASPAPQAADRPAAWVVFSTKQRISARLLVARVDSTSGRSFRVDGPKKNCVRSTILSGGSGSSLRAGGSYTVRIYSRASIAASSPRKLIATRSVTARSFKVSAGGAHAPGCSVKTAALSATAAMHTGISRFFARLHAVTVSESFACNPVTRVGQHGACRGGFVVRRGSARVAYRLTSAAATFRNTSDSIEYRLHARASGATHGLPTTTGGFTGYLQR